MKISVIVPVYNVQRYLDECITSVLALPTDKEIILVDDGSTDQSGAICDGYASKYDFVKVIHKKNGGLSSARNEGIKKSTGDYILFLDSDDFLNGEQTGRILSALDGNTDVYVGSYRNYYENTGEYQPENTGSVALNGQTVGADEFVSSIPKNGNVFYLIACRFIVNRAFLLSHELFFTEGIYHEDEEWVQRLLSAAGTVCAVNACFYEYRQNRAGSIMAELKPKRITDSVFILKRCKALMNTDISIAKKDFLLGRVTALYISVIINLNVLTGNDYENTKNELIRTKRTCPMRSDTLLGKITLLMSRLFGIKLTASILRFLNTVKRKIKS